MKKLWRLGCHRNTEVKMHEETMETGHRNAEVKMHEETMETDRT